MQNEDFINAKDKYWHDFICRAIPQELQNLYRDEILKIKSGFEAGAKFVETYYKIYDTKRTK